ncbi:acyl-CoA dehydrogenase family protein [Nocardia australiensis]|uniref:acyl-CoA dehydrogenase family protein n=1 Tax=Nocardia australiensis TaxID=2887191 RepID=UPI001D13FF87|nr:acyl-CoA dehydrogenase family protein [Nocardia australiensis]
MDSLFDYLVTEAIDTQPIGSVAEAWARHRVAAARFATSVDRAIAGGFGADRMGFAFLSGYQEAVRSLLPEVPDGDLVAVSATEAGGAHPSAIRTTLVESDGRATVHGTKTFTTLGTAAQRLLVFAGTGKAADGRNRLRAVLVDTEQPGVRRTDLPTVAFAPEIPHATVVFEEAVARVLPGDGYADYLKPFRTVEDAHVLAATLGWLVRVGRESDWPRPVLQRLLAAVATVRGLEVVRPSSPGVHIALSGAFELLEQVLVELDPLWECADPVIRERWERDRPLLAVAGRVRAMRLTAAWNSLANTERWSGSTWSRNGERASAKGGS